jgi:glycine hydroxymethyltransferase
VSGKTDNHIILMDLRSKGITGKDSEKALGLANITVNKNAVPNDPQSPFVTSGIRLGTPAITTRGFKEKEVSIISNWICDVVLNNNDENIIADIKNKVITMCKDFPVYNI